MAFYFYFCLNSSYKEDTQRGRTGEYYIDMYTGGARSGSVECRVWATTLVVLWRRDDGVEGKPLVAHTCLLVLFS